ncbi:MAG: alkaline phosphatase family protein [Thermodesulfobacteriota bacterium]
MKRFEEMDSMANESRKRRVLVIGLDGATFEILTPLIERGFLPNLKKFIENGASGPLESTIPPISGPAWLAMATGMSPDKSGVYDFLICQNESYHLKSIGSTNFAGHSVWDILTRGGKNVGILNFPLLRPPYKINGFMVSGLGAVPGEEFTFPKNLKEELKKVLGEQYEILLPYGDPHYNDIGLFFKDLNRLFNKQYQAIEFLLQKKEWNLFWVVLLQTDWLQHLLWRHIDANHPLNEGKKSLKYLEKFNEFWAQIDKTLGSIYQMVRKDTNILIVSDHGFGPCDQVFKLNAWLEREGYLFRKKKGTDIQIKNMVFSFLQKVALKCSKINFIPSAFYKWGRRSLGSLTPGVWEGIDLERSLAFDPGHTMPFGGIYINNRLVDDPSERQKIAREIQEKLQNWGNQQSVEIQIWPTNQIHQNRRVLNCPDLIVGIGQWRCAILKDKFDGELFENRAYSPRHTGSHRLEGIFIGCGPDIKAIKLNKVKIFDIAPTLLFMSDEAIPSEMDGRVLTEIFEKNYLENRPVMIKEKRERGDQDSQTGLSDEEERSFIKQLKDLGYL